jgi:hypothetical protein
LAEGRILTPQEKSEFNSQADYGGEDPDAKDEYGYPKEKGFTTDAFGIPIIPDDVFAAGLGSVAAMGGMKIRGGLRPGLKKQQAQTTTDMSTGKSLAQRQTAADELNAKMDQLAPRPAVQRAQDRVQQQATQDVAQQLKNPGPSVWKNPKTGVVSNTPPPADVALPAPLKSLGGKSNNDKSVTTQSQTSKIKPENNDPYADRLANIERNVGAIKRKVDPTWGEKAKDYGVKGGLLGLGGAATWNYVNGKKTDNNDSTTANDDPDLKIDKDYENDERPLYVPPEEKSAESNKSTPVQTKDNSSEKNTVKSTDSGEDDSMKIDKNYDETDIIEELNSLEDQIKIINLTEFEDSIKLINYINKVATLIHNELLILNISVLLHTLTFKIKGQHIPVKINWIRICQIQQ